RTTDSKIHKQNPQTVMLEFAKRTTHHRDSYPDSSSTCKAPQPIFSTGTNAFSLLDEEDEVGLIITGH
ncbi:unnamed protein product, partial [Mycena citricolor]